MIDWLTRCYVCILMATPLFRYLPDRSNEIITQSDNSVRLAETTSFSSLFVNIPNHSYSHLTVITHLAQCEPNENKMVRILYNYSCYWLLKYVDDNFNTRTCWTLSQHDVISHYSLLIILSMYISFDFKSVPMNELADSDNTTDFFSPDKSA